MFKVLVCFSIVAYVLATGDQDYYAPPKYEFQYGVQDKHTGDNKQQQEQRQGDKVTGSYSFLEADGTRRIVHYEADDHNGFNARVERVGHAQHPQHYRTNDGQYFGQGHQ
ncbi:adult-specific cuticular protein ACP-20-like [Onthophagus taurus]|uniref:adult-specific cuticular protein ACP-20-like n=1 Tax=Onthophagus taurus TaxID=166361 RepID=UPI000C20D124|nr:adult-specific cuticular protein ACP-20-like [Onthophagus taurus]